MPPCEALSAALSSRTHRAATSGIRSDFWQEKPADTVHLFEAAIDLLSYATYLKCEGKDYKSESLLSLIGRVSAKERDEGQQNPHSSHNFFECQSTN